MSLDLTTNYGGLILPSPLVVGACPLTAQDPMRVAMATAGAGAIVLPSLFQEELLRRNRRAGRLQSDGETRQVDLAAYDPFETRFTDAESYLRLVRHACSQSPIPIIASLNGAMVRPWIDFAAELQSAGASAIELSLHRNPPEHYESARAIEETIIDAVGQLSGAISVPLFVKLGHEFTSMGHLATQLLSGAQGLVLFGRTPQTDITLDDMEVKSQWRLTPPGSIVGALDLIMRVHAHCPAMPLAASGGISSPSDLIKTLLAGADVAMVTSAIYRESPDVIRTYLDGLRVFLSRHRIQSIAELRRQRPIEFSSDEQRRAYKAALTTKLTAEQTQIAAASIRGDRFGHPSFLHET